MQEAAVQHHLEPVVVPREHREEAVRLVLAECEKGSPLKLAAKEVSARCGIAKSVLYNEAVKRRE